MTNSRGLYDDEIDCLGTRMLAGTATRWLGVFARDELPSEQELLRAAAAARLIALVFINQPASEPGQHGLAIYGTAAKPGGSGLDHVDIEFFDSYALPPSSYALHTHFKRISDFSKLPLQSPSSALCGHYCLYFLFARSHGLSFHAIITQHHSRTPDEYVYSIVCKYITPRAIPCSNHHRQCSQIKCSFC